MTPDSTGWPPPSEPPPAGTSQTFQKINKKVILLSCFDGIGTAALALDGLVESVDLYIAWEVDDDCKTVLKERHPTAMNRGDFLRDDPKEVAEIVRRHDPTGEMLVLFASAPPCPDFSRIKEDPPGSAGEEGQKFTAYCSFAREIEAGLPNRRVGYIVENVVMNKKEADFFSSRLDCEPVVLDAQDHGLINRPRLWWTRVGWGQTKHSPLTGEKIRWTKSQKFYRIHYDGKVQEASELDLQGLKLHHEVESHAKRVPCLTTPAPTEAGRDPPKKLKGRVYPAQRSRWLDDGRRFAPWQYSQEAMLHSPDGSMTTPSADAKEQLHQLPKGYTKVQSVPERSRHRMLANGWHLGSARFITMLVLQAMMGKLSAAPAPTPSSTALQQMMEIIQTMQPVLGPGKWPRDEVCIAQASSGQEHWELAKQAIHPIQRPPLLEPGLQQCIDLHKIIGGSLPRMRTEIVDEVERMAMDRHDDTVRWWKNLPQHVAQVYWDNEHSQISQIPLLLDLLGQAKMPGLGDLSEDLQRGFEVTGKIHEGAGWMPRADGRYEHPVSQESFLKNNRQYTLAKLSKNRTDPQWAVMLKELEVELQKGRMSGPYEAPDWWPVKTTSIGSKTLQPLPRQDICTSFCFSVQQTDKVRRCEDFRRSGHNSTVVASDVPHHHDIKTFVDLALTDFGTQECAMVWAQDLNGAYRQFPVRDPDDCYCVLMTPHGPILLRHHAMTFGAVSSVWNFNRAADAFTFLSRRLLATAVGHYVDDFIGVEPTSSVHSGYDQFTRLTRVLGLRMKEKKALSPAASQKVSGIVLTIETEQVTLAPHQDRCAKTPTTIQKAIQSNVLQSEVAHKLAGKLVFLTSTLFGQLGRAALQPLYARAHGLSQEGHGDQLNGPLRSALMTLQNLLQEIQPRVIPRKMQEPVVVIYSDAYFVLEGRTLSPGSDNIPTQWHKTKCHTYENGWGFVIHHEGTTYYSAGRIPTWVIKRFCTRKAYIYFLEMAAQFLAFLACRSLNRRMLLSFIDNTSGFFALKKGYCKDLPICNLIALVWRVLAHHGWHLHLEWVQSEFNISDQVSRHNFDEMHSMGAQWLDLNTQQIFQILPSGNRC